MSTIWRRWVSFWSEKETPKPIAGFRIGMGFTLFYTFASPYFSDAWIPIWVDAKSGGVRHYNQVPWLIDLLGGPTQTGIETFILLTLMASLMLIIGIGSRWAALFGMFAMNSISWHNPMASGGHDDLIANGLWILFFVPADTTWSIRSRILHGTWTNTTPVPAFARRLLLLQLIIMYCSTGLQKISAHWIPFGSMDALWYILQQPTWARQSFEWLAPWFVLTQLATFGTWCFEVFSPLLLVWIYFEHPSRQSHLPNALQLLMQRIPLRWMFIITGIGLHLGIWITMDVGPFSMAALCYYWTVWPFRELVEMLRPSTDCPTRPAQASTALPE